MESSWGGVLAGPAGPLDMGATASFVFGGLLLVWSAYIHFHLWGETGGYRSIATIGPLFLLQSIAGLVIGLGVIVVRRLWAALVGIGFALATLAGFLLSVDHGLFGFKDSWLAPFAQQAFGIEVAAVVVLGVAAALFVSSGSSPHARAGVIPRRPRDVGTTPRAGSASFLPVGRRPGPALAQRSPANRSSSGSGAFVVSKTRTKNSAPMSRENISSPISRKKMLSLWLAWAASDAYLRPGDRAHVDLAAISSSGVPKSGFSSTSSGPSMPASASTSRKPFIAERGIAV